jgi:hypothetical protein
MGDAKRDKAVSSEMYTTEASASRKKAKAEQAIPDPPKGDAERAIEGSVIVIEDDGDPDGEA